MLPVLPAAERFHLARRVASRVLAMRGPMTALSAFRMVWSSHGGGFGSAGGSSGSGWNNAFGWWGTLPGTKLDLAREVGDPALNAAVSIALNWIADQMPEPELIVERRQGDGTWVKVPEHPLPAMVNQANPDYDGDCLWAATATSYCVSGDGYWLIARGAGGAGQPLQLWHVPYWELAPRWPADGSAFITDYLYRPGGRGTGYPVERKNVVHFRFGLDYYRGQRHGVSRLKPILRSVLSDNEADTYTAALLRNMGVPGVFVSPKSPDPQAKIGPEAREELEEVWVSKFTGDNRGKPMVGALAMEVQKVSLTPEELVLDKIRTVPEDRICAALRIPAMVLGLTSGHLAKTYANYGEARRAAYDDCIKPLQKRFARALDRQLLPYLGDPLTERVSWDYSQVEALAEDEDARHKRARDDYQSGIAKRSEARALAGYQVDPAEEDGYVYDLDCTVLPDEDEPKALPAGDDSGKSESDDDRDDEEKRRQRRRDRRKAGGQ